LELFQEVFGKEKNPCRLVFGVASLPLATPVALELIFEMKTIQHVAQLRDARRSWHYSKSKAARLITDPKSKEQ
jgi:hypothetical protein